MAFNKGDRIQLDNGKMATVIGIENIGGCDFIQYHTDGSSADYEAQMVMFFEATLVEKAVS